MRILVSGSSGFIGKNLCEKIFNNEITGVCNEVSKKQFSYKEISYKNFLSFKEFQCDIFIHTAAKTIPENNLDLIEYNSKILGEFLKRISNTKLIINLSSMAVFDNSNEKIIYNESKPSTSSNYGKSKLICEEIINDYCKTNKVNLLNLRLSGIIGKESKNNFLSNLNNKFLNKIFPIIAFNKNNLFNHICDIDNLTNFINYKLHSKYSKYSNINICSTEPILINELMQKFLDYYQIDNSLIQWQEKYDKNYVIDDSHLKNYNFPLSATTETINKFLLRFDR